VCSSDLEGLPDSIIVTAEGVEGDVPSEAPAPEALVAVAPANQVPLPEPAAAVKQPDSKKTSVKHPHKKARAKPAKAKKR
jgi:hypothetical protein